MVRSLSLSCPSRGLEGVKQKSPVTTQAVQHQLAKNADFLPKMPTSNSKYKSTSQSNTTGESLRKQVLEH